MASLQGSAPPVEASPSVELRVYLVRSDGKGGAFELGRLQHYADSLRPREAKASLQSPARDRSPAPASSSDDETAAEFGGKEAATLYLVVLVGGEVKKVARLSSFMEGQYCTEKADEANAETETSSKDSDVLQKEEEKTSSPEEEEEDEEEDAHAGTVSGSSSQEEETPTSYEEQTSSSREAGTDESSYTSSGNTDEEVGGAQYSVQIRLWPESARLVLVLFDLGRWKLSRGYHVNWLSHNEEHILKMFGFGSAVTQPENSDPKEASIWFKNCTSWLDFKGSLEYSDRIGQIISSQFTPSMNEFCVNGKLGDGGSGNVYQCSYIDSSITDFQYAIKIMDIDDEHDCVDTINFKEPREVNIMSSVKDEHVVSFYQAWSANGTFKSGLSSHKQERSNREEFSCGDYLSEARYVAIQMERCLRSLKHDMPYGPRQINIDSSWMIFEEVTKAVQSLHHKGIIHRDLKPDIFLFGANGSVKVCDLGHACFSESKIGELVGTPNRGTLLYMAPELDGGPVTQKVDIYSLGIIFLELFHPFSTVQEQDAFLRELRNDVYPTDLKVDKAFLKKLLALRHSDRPSTDEILEYIVKRQQDISAQD